MAEERVVLTAELKDQMSAPLETATKRVEGFTRTVEDGAKKQTAATQRSTTAIAGAVGKQNRLFSGMTGTVGKATTGTSRLFGNMRASINRSLDGVATHATTAGEKAGSGLVGGMRKMIGPVAGLLGAGMFAKFIADAGVASDATDKFKSTMSFAGLDTSAIDAATKAAKAYADQTVYDLPTIQNTFAQLASNGVKNYADLTKASGNLNAVAGGNAETFKSVSRTLTQSAGAGKLMTEDWNMLADAIPGAAGPLMKSLKDAGAYTGNFRKAMEDGQITSEEFQAAIMKLGTKPVAVEAAKSTKTFEGALGNLQATINSKLMGALDKIKPAATDAIGALTGGLGKALEWTGDAAQGLYDLIVKGDFSGAFSRAFNVEEDSPIVDMLFDLRDAAIELPDKLKEVATKLWDMREPIGVVAGLILTLLLPRFAQLGTEALINAGKVKLAWAMTKGAAIQAAAVNAWAALAMVGGWVLMGAQATIQAVKIAAAWLIALGPVGWIIAAVGLLVGAFVWAYNNIGWFKDGVDAAFKWIGEAAQNVANWFVEAFKWIGDAATNVGNWVVGAFNNITSFWNTNVMPVLNAIGSVFAAVFDWIGRLVWNFATIAVFIFQKLVSFWNTVLLPGLQAVGNFFMTILNWIYATIIQPVINLIVGAFNGIIDFWNGVLLPALQWLGNGFMVTLNWIYNTIVKPVIDLLVGAFGMLTDFWNNTLKPVIDTVGGWFSDIIGGAINGVKGFIDDLVKGFQIMMTFISDKLTPIIDGIRGTFEDLGKIIGDVLGKIGEFANNPLGGVQDWLGIKKDGNGQGVMPSNSGGGVYSGGGVVEAAFAGGGVLGGYSPGNDSILARLSPGESVLVPELTRAIGPQNIMAANAEASGGRKAGSGPSMTSGFSNSRGGGSTMTIHAPVQITVQGGAGGVDYAALQAAVNAGISEVIADSKRSY